MSSVRIVVRASLVTASIALVALPHAATGQEASERGEVTFSEQVATLIQENCQVCHREGGMGPMPLTTYDQARRYATRIRAQVASRAMPPYHYDREVGIQELEYDMRLSDAEIATIVAWVDAGAPQGDPALMPPPKAFPDPAEWRMAEMFGPPDIVVPTTPYDVPASGNDKWWEPTIKISGLESDRYIRAIEVKPSVAGRRVVHHANTNLMRPGDDGELYNASGGRFTEYAGNKLGEIVPEGAGRLIPADGWVEWSVHYHPDGTAIEDDVTELGFWLYPEGYVPEFESKLHSWPLQGDLLIPPNGTAMTQGFLSFDHPIRIDSYQPHGHLRLRGASMEIFHPKTGEREVVSMVSNWSTWWAHSHIYKENVAPLVPTGSVVILTHWYDNTENNPYNPAPNQWVYPGSRTNDEMSHDWVGVTHLTEEQYEELVSLRQARPVASAPDSPGR
ncbi:MAG: cytochrome c [Gemmatimonadetes bacterium]|nr:cytochrome c [Gemmatimonadota bacterium]